MNAPLQPGPTARPTQAEAAGQQPGSDEVQPHVEETALVVKTPGAPLELSTGWTPDQVQLVKETIAKSADLTDDEFRLFIATCQRMKRDPLARQIHAVKR